MSTMQRPVEPKSLVLEEIDYEALLEPVRFSFALERREFVQLLGAGLVVSVIAGPALAQRGRGRRGGGGFRGGPPPALAARIHIGPDGAITVLSGKVEAGQGARTQIAMAAAEELRLPLERINVVLADTAATPDDGMTAGSRTTPSTIPSVRKAAAAVRELLAQHAADQWNVAADAIEIREGSATRPSRPDEKLTYANLVGDAAVVEKLAAETPDDVELTAVDQWQVLGEPHPAVNVRDKVTGAHKFPSDMTRPEMLYGAILRSPTYRGKLLSVDASPAKAMPGVVVVEDKDFVGAVAPTSYAARQAIEALAKTAKWEDAELLASDKLYEHLHEHADSLRESPFAEEIKSAAKSLREKYHIAYVQHAPLEPRVALAEWADGKLTVWTGTQGPFRVKGELQGAFRLADDAVRVVVPDFGSGYGGKHTGEVAVEAARLAKAAGKPVMLRWTREEEFTWAYFRPAGVIEMEASLDDANRIATWRHVNISSGGNSIQSPYNVGKKDERHVRSQPPLREGSYRALASTANSFARESFMDELAAAAGVDPLTFRLSHLDEPRLRPVLEAAAEKFRWHERVKSRQANRGMGLACSWDKGSVVAACVEVEVDRDAKRIDVLEVCEAFECGKIMNPDNLRSQIEGAIVMGLGPALSEEMRFGKNGAIENASFRRYRVPHFKDTPAIDVVLVDRPDLPSVGAGETPIIVVAPAIANAVFQATGNRIRQMPIKISS